MRGITASKLKWIAVITMTIDHIGLCFMGTTPYYSYFRIVGRMAFPIYCFLLVQGFYHTRNVNKYMLRLLLFALISEVPFDLMISGRWIDFSSQNVYFTLLLGLISLRICSACAQKNKEWLGFVSLLAVSVIAYIMRTDYYVWGILIIFIFYFVENESAPYEVKNNPQTENTQRGNLCSIEAVVLQILVFLMMGGRQIYAAFSLIPIMMYKGTKGKASVKYFFYAYYPIHMLILYAIGRLLV
jgi:hypothetical protein